MKRESNVFSWSFDAIGTRWTIDIFDSLSQKEILHLQKLINTRIETFDQTYSRFRTDGVIAKIAQIPGVYRFDNDFPPLMKFYKHVYDLTRGSFSPLIGDTLVQMGYDHLYRLDRTEKVSPPLPWHDVLQYDDDEYLMVKRPVILDFGAAGKGYLVDIVGTILEQHGISSYCIDAGGDIVANRVSRRIGLEHPDNPHQIIGSVEIQNQSICASGVNRRSWRGVHHIVDARSGKPAQKVKATWVIADTGMIADGLATALFFVEPLVLLSHYTFHYVIVWEDFSYSCSHGCPIMMYS